MSYIINSLMLYQPCAARTYMSSKNEWTTSRSSFVYWHTSNVPATRKKQQSPRYAELRKKCGPSIIWGLVSTINTLGKNVASRTTGKQRRATILRTLHPVYAIKCYAFNQFTAFSSHVNGFGLDSRILCGEVVHAFNRYAINWSHLCKVQSVTA